MNLRIQDFTLVIILFDNLLNWFLAILLTFFPHLFAQQLAAQPLLPTSFYVITGLCFWCFALWQLQVFILPWKLSASNLQMAALLAWLPAVGLTVGLFLPFEIYSLSRGLLWMGNIYMFLLGGWYWWVGKSLIRPINKPINVSRL